MNSTGVYNVSEASQRYGAQVCLLSSALVFNGEEREFVETDIPDSNTILGRTKASAEFFIQKSSLNYIIFRCSHLYGRSLSPVRKTWCEFIDERLAKSQALEADTNVSVGHLDVSFLGMIIQICFEKEVQNRLFQVSSQDTMSHYEFTKKYLEIFYDNRVSVGRARWPFPSRGGPDSGGKYRYLMDVKNIESYLSIKLPSIEESLQLTMKRWGYGGATAKVQAKRGKIQYI